MKRLVIALFVGCVIEIVVGPVANAQMAKEGTYAGMVFFSGTFKTIAMEKERVQMNYEVTGISRGQDEKSLFYNATIHCLGSLHAIKGAYDDDNGFCAYTQPDGDQIFVTYEAKGKLGVSDGSVSANGTAKIVGGTGKLAGIQGSGELERHSLRATAPGVFNTFNITKGSYKIP